MSEKNQSENQSETSTQSTPEPIKNEAQDEPKEESTAEQTSVEEVVETPASETVAEEVPVEAAAQKLKSGMTVRVYLRISEGKKDRTQMFQGIIIRTAGSTAETRNITVRKVTKGYGVEKIIPLSMPTLEKIEIIRIAKVKRSRLYFLRSYGKRLKETVVVNN